VLSLKLIVGTTRQGRAADLVAPWVIERAKAHGAFDVDVLDLRDWPLPMFGEGAHSIGDINDPTYTQPIVKQWNQTVKSGDAYLIVTSEYLHSVPGELKNALDSVFVSFGFRNKPAAFVGYSSGVAAGVRAVEHLALIMVETDAVPLRSSVVIANVQNAFVEGRPTDVATDAALTIVLDDLAWWGNALQQAREQGELAPSGFRLRAAVAELRAARGES